MKVKYSFQKILRDYFAAHALQGILASDKNLLVSSEKAAERAYIQADKMLKIRHSSAIKNEPQK